MPPETLAESNTHHSATPYDPRAWDAYSLGVMLWELWYCEPPWEGRPFHQVGLTIIATSMLQKTQGKKLSV